MMLSAARGQGTEKHNKNLIFFEKFMAIMRLYVKYRVDATDL
jgi:hypothetical protein